MTMGEERYEQAVVSPNLLKYLIRLMYDEEYGLQHGNYRESVNYFGQSQLEQVVDQMYAAGPPQSAPEEAPQSSSEEVTSKIHRHLTADPQTFANLSSERFSTRPNHGSTSERSSTRTWSSSSIWATCERTRRRSWRESS